jgi:hypothetical protein
MSGAVISLARYGKRTAGRFDEPTGNGYAEGVINKIKGSRATPRR